MPDFSERLVCGIERYVHRGTVNGTVLAEKLMQYLASRYGLWWQSAAARWVHPFHRRRHNPRGQKVTTPILLLDITRSPWCVVGKI